LEIVSRRYYGIGAHPDTVSAKPSHNARNLSRGTVVSNYVLLLFPVFGIVIYALNFKPSSASMMKFSRHLGRSLESIANKLWQNVLSASRIVGICSNLARYWSVELFAKRSTIPFTTSPELSTATKSLKEVRRLIMALEIEEDGTVDSFQAFLLFLYTDQLRV
jgi:hypothetical protein